MFEGSGGMDDDRLNALLREDEAAITDDGFARKVAADATGQGKVRQMALFAAAGAGSAFALSGMAKLVELMPRAEAFESVFGKALLRVQTPAFVGEVAVHPAVMIAGAVAFCFAIALPAFMALRQD
jgi:hypothetical protein